MYGMIHRGIRQMVLDAEGHDAWSAIAATAGIGAAELISAEVYDDAITVRILEATALRLDIPLGTCLERLGTYWVYFAERGFYGDIMRFVGNDLVSFIASLDRMHQAVSMAMPAARVPSFGVVAQEPGMIRVRYCSGRAGLERFVVGLLHGVMARFGLAGTVTQVPDAPMAQCAEFVLEFAPTGELRPALP